jgi:3-hydroxyacyl-CoA dehydrogenase
MRAVAGTIMAQPVTLQIKDGIAVVTLDAAPVNTLSDHVIGGLSAAFVDATEQPGVAAVVLAARGSMFSAGFDVRDFATSGQRLSALCDQIENMPFPVVAALQGAALGGGAELALAAHYRLAVAGAAIGQPEVMLGLIPAAGGTQRLPRLVSQARSVG